MLTRRYLDHRRGYAAFGTERGAEEAFLLIGTRPGGEFSGALSDLRNDYEAALAERGLSYATLVFSRVYLSDVQNRREALEASAFFRDLSQGAVSVIEQRPADQSPVAVYSYHVKARSGALTREKCKLPPGTGRNGALLHGENYRMLWLAGFEGGGRRDAKAQMGDILVASTEAMRAQNMDWLPDALRSWIYVRDIDNNYLSIVDARREFFHRNGLTDQTRYLASTGIEGRGREGESLVGMDLLCIGGLEPAQIVKMAAPDQLSPASHYGVTFERGLRVDFGDRTHLHISGTASIGEAGQLLHAGDVENQLVRTVRNIAALLSAQGCALADLAYVIVYVRDPAATERVRNILRLLLPEDLPRLTLEACVCRPGWLVEIEALGFRPARTLFKTFL